MFLPTSRYFDTPTATLVTPDGRTILYARRRFVPSSRAVGTSGEYAVTQGDRVDNVTARTLGNPEVFWRLCDANDATRPDELVETVGRTIRVPFFNGVR